MTDLEITVDLLNALKATGLAISQTKAQVEKAMRELESYSENLDSKYYELCAKLEETGKTLI